jgi:hypothetical protein
MKIIYLKASTKELLIADIAKVFENYNGEIEFSNGIIHGHYIGQIIKTINQKTGDVIEWLDGYHANLLVPKDFDESIFVSLVIPAPENPVHQFA